MKNLLTDLLDLSALPRSMWRNRSLLRMLVKRNVEIRYKGSVLGLVWSFVQPLMMMTVYTIVFGVFFGVLGLLRPYPFRVAYALRIAGVQFAGCLPLGAFRFG